MTWDMVEQSIVGPEDFDSGIKAFDELQPNQRLALLAQVGKALKDEAEPRPKLTAHAEATVAAIFRVIGDLVESEIDSGDEDERYENPTFWRERVLAAYVEADEKDNAEEGVSPFPQVEPVLGTPPVGKGGEVHEEEPWCPPRVDSDEADDWEFMVDCLANRVLWDDDDFVLGDAFLDADPSEGRSLKTVLGIDDDYYTSIAPDPTDAQLGPIRQQLREVCARPEREQPEVLAGLEDSHHDLLVGPCDEATIAAETSCLLVGEVMVMDSHDFDCSHAEWAEMFRDEVHRASAAGTSTVHEAPVSLTPEQSADAHRASLSGKPLFLDDGVQVVPRSGEWILTNAQGHVLVDVEDPSWARDGDPQLPALRFDTSEAALAAHLRAVGQVKARTARHKAAMERLGRDLDEQLF